MASGKTSDRIQPATMEQREFERIEIMLPGSIFVAAEETTLECQVLNISGGGAGIRCEEPPPLQTFVILYIHGFGRFECVTTRFVMGELGLRFVCVDAKRQRLLASLTNFVNDGIKIPTHLRRHKRIPSIANGFFARPTGEHVRCDVLDISLQGLSLRTAGRPPVGELVNMGNTYGRVVRHHKDGIAIQFLEVAPSPAPGNNGH